MNAFVFDLETCSGQGLPEANKPGLYDVNCLRDRWNRDLIPVETMTEKDKVIGFNGCSRNPVMSMLKYTSENYEGDQKTYIDEDGDEILTSYRLLLVAKNASGFDSWVVLSSLAIRNSRNKKWKNRKGVDFNIVSVR